MVKKHTVDGIEIRAHNKGFTGRLGMAEFLWISTGNGLQLGAVNAEHLKPTMFTDEVHTVNEFLERQAIYARTVAHLYRLPFRTLVELQRETHADGFLRISRSMLVDPKRVGGRRPHSLELGIELEAPLRKLEWVHASEAGFRRYEAWLKYESSADSADSGTAAPEPEPQTVVPAPVRPVRPVRRDRTETGPGPSRDPSPIHARVRSDY